MRKKLLSLTLALALCLGLTVPAFAAELKIVQVSVPTVEEYEVRNMPHGFSMRAFHDCTCMKIPAAFQRARAL